MKSIFYTSAQHSLNEIEYFVDEICEEYNLSNSLYGNILISITESIKILEKYSKHGRISFRGNQKSLKFTFDSFKQIEGAKSIFDYQDGNSDLASDSDKSIFMVNALSDNLIIDRENKRIICVFKNEGKEAKISKHRKEFLKKYLNEEVIANV